MKNKKIEKITFRTTPEIRRNLTAISESQDRTISFIINSILKGHFSAQEKSSPPRIENQKYFSMEWIKYSFSNEDVANKVHLEFLNSIRKLTLYSRKAADDLLVIGFTDLDENEIVLISEDNQIMALDVVSRKFEQNYEGGGYKIPANPTQLILHFGNQTIFNELAALYKYI